MKTTVYEIRKFQMYITFMSCTQSRFNTEINLLKNLWLSIYRKPIYGPALYRLESDNGWVRIIEGFDSKLYKKLIGNV